METIFRDLKYFVKKYFHTKHKTQILLQKETFNIKNILKINCYPKYI